MLSRLSRLVFFLCCCFLVAFGNPATKPSGLLRSKSDLPKLNPVAQSRLSESYGRLPLSFEANIGQVDPQVKFVARGSGYTLFLTSTEMVLSLPGKTLASGPHEIAGAGLAQEISDPWKKFRQILPGTSEPPQGAAASNVVRLKLTGANPNPNAVGLEELPGKVNYFIGSDPAKWRTEIPTYVKVRYDSVYPGIDLVYYGNQGKLEHDFIVEPGADPGSIRFAVENKGKIEIDAQGNLLLDDKCGLRLQRPVLYQERDGVRSQVAGEYVIQDSHQIGFRVERYDASLALVIDPVLAYSTYLGGSGNEDPSSIAVDSAGNAYVAGTTSSTDFPTGNASQSGYAGGKSDLFVTKLNSSGNALVYSTYLGGSGDEDPCGIAVDFSGNVYLATETTSTNFPTSNAFQSGFAGGACDVTVTKLSSSGNALVYSTYLGGSGDDWEYNIAVDSAGSAYVTGSTASTNFPILNAYQSTNPGGGFIAFVTKLSPSGNTLVYSTYLGGSGIEVGTGIAVDGSGNAFVAGVTDSTDFPTANAFQPGYGGGTQDVFVTKLNSSGTALVYSTYLGGSGRERESGIAVDSAGNAYVRGFTTSTNFPTVNAFQSANAGGYDNFVTKLNSSGNALVYSTYLGGSGADYGTGLAVDSFGSAYVSGPTESTNFPTVNAFQPGHAGGRLVDISVTKLSPSGSGLIYSSYLGGTGDEYEYDGIAVDFSGNAYVTGSTNSLDFPLVNPLSGGFNGRGDAFIVKIGNSSATYFPQVAVGGGWFTHFTITNIGSTAASGNLTLTDQEGSPLGVYGLLTDSSGTTQPAVAGASFALAIPSGGTVFLSAGPLDSTTSARVGWGQLESTGGLLSGVATYEFVVGGKTMTNVGVLQTQPLQYATIPVDNDPSQGKQMAYAVANPSAQTISVKLALVSQNGTVVDDTVTITLGPRQHRARYLWQELARSTFKGSLVLRGQGGATFIAVALAEKQGLMTVIPLIAGKAPGVPN